MDSAVLEMDSVSLLLPSFLEMSARTTTIYSSRAAFQLIINFRFQEV